MDDSTFADRLKLAMHAKALALGQPYRQKELLADINRVVGRPQDDPLLTQQALSKLMTGKAVESVHTPAIAAALGVSSLWLAYNVGPASILEDLRRKLG